eukprot:CAMPEP_0174731240 /NCGR_PEP_ID=MMETSP1094-20130205/57154_1 /TAXON_ID=156173 /ORGANISM="Chrysochromulina brevifilum, Strain UTEX LB 985" /LENGTH=66 /DNA_ID=CAMNT_0015933599 /DNA_START=55 /DNA_END=251 /DNA_ORIENTATION=+
MTAVSCAHLYSDRETVYKSLHSQLQPHRQPTLTLTLILLSPSPSALAATALAAAALVATAVTLATA